ncbi:MAG: Ig domain-containing protein group 2 domain-containing protein, partial [Parcubacteria group bacterium Gr01-1014_70]
TPPAYSPAGTYHPKVIVERGSPLQEKEARIDVVAIPPSAGNDPPTANAGPGHSISISVAHNHTGGSASDPDGNLASYSWQLISCPTACPVLSGTVSGSLSGSSSAVPPSLNPPPRYTPTAAGNYVLQLTVTDSDGLSDTDTVTDTVVAPSFTFTCLDADPAAEPPDPCDVVVEFSPALLSLSTTAELVINAVGGFSSPVTFDVTGVFEDYPVGSPPIVAAIPGFEEYFNGNRVSSFTETSPYDNVDFSVIVSKLAADPKLDKIYTVRFQASGGSITRTLDLRLILKASSPEFQER